MIRDVYLGFGFFPPRIRKPDVGVKKALDPGSGSVTLLCNVKDCEKRFPLKSDLYFKIQYNVTLF